MGKVALITTGGTIASHYRVKEGDVGVGRSSDHFVELVNLRMPDIALEAHDFASVGSYMLSLGQAFNLVTKIERVASEADIDGVVVTHGTDTLEETAYMADLLVGVEKPVVFTGSQRPSDDPESDGPRNFLDAVRVAADPACRKLGAVVVFEQEVHAARDATKVHTTRVGTFRSHEHGKLGEVDGDGVHIHRLPAGRRIFSCNSIETRVQLIKLAMGMGGDFVDFAIARGARGIVLEAFGRGNVTPEVFSSVERALERGVPVLVASRCPEGRVAPVYGGSGGAGLEKAGAIFAGDLSGIKARILLSVLLGDGGSDEPLAARVVSVAM